MQQRQAGSSAYKVPAAWLQIASGLVVPTDAALGAQPEFAGYQGQMVKQADVTLLEYPWDYPLPPNVEQDNLNYYVPRTDPQGPSMSDSVTSIDSAALEHVRGAPATCSRSAVSNRSSAISSTSSPRPGVAGPSRS